MTAPGRVRSRFSRAGNTGWGVLAMREAFHHELDLLIDRVADIATAVDTAMSQATSALLGADGDLTAHILAVGLEIDEMRTALDDHAVQLLVLHQPVAKDLRTIVASLRIGNDPQLHPELAVPADLHPTMFLAGKSDLDTSSGLTRSS
jgi:phosphate uptake regulator